LYYLRKIFNYLGSLILINVGSPIHFTYKLGIRHISLGDVGSLTHSPHIKLWTFEKWG